MIITDDGGRKDAYFQHICVLLSNAQRGGVYCGTIVPAEEFFAAESVPSDEKRLEYLDLAPDVGPANSRRYPIIERHDADFVRREDESRRSSADQARSIALPLIADWLKSNGYEEQDESFLRRSDKEDGQSHTVTVEGDTTSLGDEGAVRLFTVHVDYKSGKAGMLLDNDCAEFRRLIREQKDARQPAACVDVASTYGTASCGKTAPGNPTEIGAAAEITRCSPIHRASLDFHTKAVGRNP